MELELDAAVELAVAAVVVVVLAPFVDPVSFPSELQ